ADWPPGEFTLHEEARALEDLHRRRDLRRLFRRGFFYAEWGPRAYTAAGSFLRFVWETRGPAAFFRLYASPESIDLPSLVPEYLRFLQQLREPERAVALATQRYSAPPIVRKRCVHEVAALQRLAQAARDPHSAAEIWARCAKLEPDDPALLASLRRAQLLAKDPAAAETTEARALDHRELPGRLFVQEALRMRGIAAWHVGDDGSARAAFTALGKDAPPGRALEVERWLDRLGRGP